MSLPQSGAGAAPAPCVTIGMPVYNGARYLPQALDSLLGQTFTDFELVISDNASTDATQSICEAYAARDPRVRYLRQPRNRGAVFNWNYVVELARGEFFKWASANDYCAPQMLELCVAALRNDPGAVVSYGRTELIDDDGATLGEYPYDVDVREARPSVRFRRLCLELRLNNAQSGLNRLAVLRRTGIERDYAGGDMALSAELGLHGGFVKVPEVLLYRRMGRQSASKFLSASELRAFLGTTATSEPDRVALDLHLDYLRSVLRAPIGLREKTAALGFTLRSAWWNRAALWSEWRSRTRGASAPAGS